MGGGRAMNDLHDLKALIDSKIPVILVETTEELRTIDLFRRLATDLKRPVLKWTATTGMRPLGSAETPLAGKTEDASKPFDRIRGTHVSTIFLLIDFHPYIHEAVNVRSIKDIALAAPRTGHTLVFISHRLKLPEELKPYYASFELTLPDRKKLTETCHAQAEKWKLENQGKSVRSSRQHLERLIDNLMGMPLSDAERLIRTAICDDGVIDDSDMPEVAREKFRLLNSDSVLSFEYDTSRFENIGGLKNLKEWLELRKNIFLGREAPKGLNAPKGILMLGVQGCGKSLAAKAVAGAWQVPLLRLDFGCLYNKYYGETEKNMREALKAAELMAPCVLWMDEIEKGISIGDSDDGASRRVLGTLLTWMAENNKRVFVVATANDISALPPELIRKGRFDEVFFVDLPDTNTRRDILNIHLEQRGYAIQNFNVTRLADISENFSGAELEQAIVAALYFTHSSSKTLDTDAIASAILKTRPLAVLMQEKVDQLRQWAAERTVPAD
jgi:SpoVK/Ycf46/Vps4 family AAA+-type ATPase